LKIIMPDYIKQALNTLHENGHQAYIVGGCVRDSIIGRSPKDWDVCTSALPQEIINVFNEYNTILTGVKHGTVTVVINKEHVEITTFRVDGEYSDARRPDSVEFTDNLTLDLSRRDFTMNAIAYDDDEGMIDSFGGIFDIKQKRIKCVGSAKDRFSEDYLRVLRAYRFSRQLEFSICGGETLVCYREMCKHIVKNVSAERIQSEINKILLCDRPFYGSLETIIHIIPELSICLDTLQNNPYHDYNVGVHTLKSVEHSPKQLHLRLAMLLHDTGKPSSKTTDDNGINHFYGHPKISVEIAESVLKRYKYDNDTINKVKTLILYHDIEIPINKRGVKRILNKIGTELTYDLIQIKYADMFAQSYKSYQSKHKKLEKFEALLDEVVNYKEPFGIKGLCINGKDLISLGFKQGKSIGHTLDKCVEYVIDNPESNNINDLINYVQQFKNI
jgi:tRNA nucleotidyltransferase (CCA-adding enzyme)